MTGHPTNDRRNDYTCRHLEDLLLTSGHREASLSAPELTNGAEVSTLGSSAVPTDGVKNLGHREEMRTKLGVE